MKCSAILTSDRLPVVKPYPAQTTRYPRAKTRASPPQSPDEAAAPPLPDVVHRGENDEAGDKEGGGELGELREAERRPREDQGPRRGVPHVVVECADGEEDEERRVDRIDRVAGEREHGRGEDLEEEGEEPRP